MFRVTDVSFLSLIRSDSIIGARNWCSVEYHQESGELEFDIRVEKVRGGGETKSYAVKAPAPRWDVAKQHHHLLHLKNFDKEIGTLKGQPVAN